MLISISKKPIKQELFKWRCGPVIDAHLRTSQHPPSAAYANRLELDSLHKYPTHINTITNQQLDDDDQDI